jgi:AraC-like DNA-binding protein
LAKIAATADHISTLPIERALAHGDGWTVRDVVCTLGPRDRPFEEQHSSASIAIVMEGTFQYRSRCGCETMTPGSLLLGSPGQVFECGHEHGSGDRCIAFSYSTGFLDRIEAAQGFRALRVPRLRALSPIVARVSAALDVASAASWEELSVELAGRTSQLDREGAPSAAADSAAIARVTRVVQAMERDRDLPSDLNSLARRARLSPYHFLRVFQSVTGVTPHQYLLRLRLQRAAARLRTEDTKVVDIALESGFGDLSNFIRTFRSEFGASPRAWRSR